MGKAFHAASLHARVTDKLQEPIYIILELLRAGVVHGHRFGGHNAPVLSGGPSFGSDEEQSHTLLIMRVLSTVPLNFRVGSPLVYSILTYSAGAVVWTPVARVAGLQLVCQGDEQGPAAPPGGDQRPHPPVRRRTTHAR